MEGVTTGEGVLAALRGTPALRPVVDRGLAGGLRAWLEDGAFERLGPARRAPGSIRLTPRVVVGDPHLATATSMLRGALVAQLVRLCVAGAVIEDPMDDAACAMSASGRHDDLVGALVELDADEHARLASEVAAHHAVLDAAFGHIPSRWTPRCDVRQVISIAGGAVELRGQVELMLGAHGSSRACVCLVDVTTSRLEERHTAALSYLSLLETMRSGEAPLRVAALSTLDGAFVVHDVTPELLGVAVEDTLRALDVESAR